MIPLWMKNIAAIATKTARALGHPKYHPMKIDKHPLRNSLSFQFIGSSSIIQPIDLVSTGYVRQTHSHAAQIIAAATTMKMIT